MVSPMIYSPIGSPFLGGLFPPQQSPLHIPDPKSQRRISERVLAARESLRFETLTLADAGEYACSVGRDSSQGPPHATRKLRLRVTRPNISIAIMEIGPHFTSLAWNDSLKVLKASEKVRLSLDVKDGHGGGAVLLRSIQLSLHNPWYSYNVMRLRPLHNYTFCLVYRLRERDEDENDVMDYEHLTTASSVLFDTCVEGRTLESFNFWNSLSTSTVLTLVALTLCLGTLLCGRGLYARFYIWHETKLR